mgnify:CR=1 FL=1
MPLLARFGAVSGAEGPEILVGDRRRLANADHPGHHALEGPDLNRPRPDFSLAEMRSGADLYFAQSENRRRRRRRLPDAVRDFGPNRFVVAIENASPVSRHLVTLFNPGDLASVHFLERRGPGVWGYYGLAWASDSLVSRLAVPQASYVDRALVALPAFPRRQSNPRRVVMARC